MLDKLRRRFVAISMSIILMVLAFFYIVTGAVFFMTITLDMKSVLQTYSATPESVFAPQIGIGDEQNSLFALHSGNVCVVEVREFGNISILDFSYADMNENTVSRAVGYALERQEDFGHINALNLFYHKYSFVNGTRIAFADSNQYFQYLEAILFDGGIFLMLSSVVLWVIMRFLASMCLKPVEKAWEQQKNFIADASHELKTPLTVILTNNGILQSHKDESVESQMQWINSTGEEASHMRELVEKLLLLAKTDNMSRKNLFEDINLSDIVMQSALQFEPVAFEKGVTLVTDIEKNIHIKGEAVALNQIVHILLDNAVKYAGVGGEAVLSLKKRRAYHLKRFIGYDIYLSAKNTGIPIPEEDMPYIFERFYRSDKARTAGSGYGLGLSICKNLASLHGADIDVTSDSENGTEFTVTFRS
ncbi:MAG: HAMP domain-containing histidine kinase [Clostridia bacterium]|nr:HAMP domain-containing histidine kinase [Clostridia bacterium]